MKKAIAIALFVLLAGANAAVTARAPVSEGGFKNCAEAQAAGYHDMRVGEPGYAPKLDRDKDGIACEWNS